MNNLKTVVLLAAMSGLLIAIGGYQLYARSAGSSTPPAPPSYGAPSSGFDLNMPASGGPDVR